MRMGGKQGRGRPHRAGPVWRPLALSAVTTSAIAVLFSPLPAAAATPQVLTAPVAPGVPAVPDAGSRPIPTGSLVMPGQRTAAPIVSVPTGLATTPLMAKIEKRRAEVALLGDQLIKLGQDRDLARERVTVAQRKQADAQAAVAIAEQEAHKAAVAALMDAAALPPGAIGSGLRDLGALARIQRGESAGEQAAARHLTLVQGLYQAAGAEFSTASARAADLSSQYDRLAAQHRKQDAALQKLERQNADQIAAAEAAEQAEDLALGEGYTGGVAGKSADPRALAAVGYALAQRGDWYLWAAEGPDRFDCSGLMWAAYRTAAAGSYKLPRVSRDQYYATRGKTVDRYSLLPGDLLFFSSSTSWTGIHHVAMYVGDGRMVEAPRSGVQVRVVPVRWTRLFAATRVYGPVDGPAQSPPVIPPDPKPPSASPSPSKSPSASPSSSKSPSASPSSSKSPSASPSSSKSPSASPSSSKSPSTPATTPAPASSAPSVRPTTSSIGSSSTSPAGVSAGTPSASRSASSVNPSRTGSTSSATASRPGSTGPAD